MRELENLCWRLAALAPGDVVGVADLGDALGAAGSVAGGANGSADDGRGADWQALLRAWTRAKLDAHADGIHAEAREVLDRVLLEAALEHTGGRRSEAAARLGLGRNTVTRKLGASRRPRRS